MSKHEIVTAGQLVYSGVSIREKGEMLSLTDMWEAAGRPDNKRPAEWARYEGAIFIQFVAETHNVGTAHIMKSQRGKGGATFAHWQVALAYAKYLSPEFHMWCNEVVRAHMEGDNLPAIPADTLDQIERSFGIMRMVAHKVTEIEKALPGIIADMVEPLVAARLAESAYLLRSGKPAKAIWDAAGLPPKIKGSTNWFGNRLKEMGCMMEGKADRGSSAIRLFDPDKAEMCMKNGLLHKSKVYASERMGQGRFKLIGGAK